VWDSADITGEVDVGGSGDAGVDQTRKYSEAFVSLGATVGVAGV